MCSDKDQVFDERQIVTEREERTTEEEVRQREAKGWLCMITISANYINFSEPDS